LAVALVLASGAFALNNSNGVMGGGGDPPPCPTC
jgi:hypothetical protein